MAEFPQGFGGGSEETPIGESSAQNNPIIPSKVNFLVRLSHPNIVKLLGYCVEDKERLLAYEFMANGSLDNRLFTRGAAFDPLSWDRRLKIVIGAARALTFLHSSEKPVIYRNFRTSKILLDSDYNAKLSGFGFAVDGPTDGMSHVSTDTVMGTWGYVDPHYIKTGHLYVKSDVYGFGVVLLEMLSGKQVLQQDLVLWAKPFLADRSKFRRVMDPQLEAQYPSEGAFQAAQLTLACVAEEPKNRPSMKEIVETLEHIEALNNA